MFGSMTDSVLPFGKADETDRYQYRQFGFAFFEGQLLAVQAASIPLYAALQIVLLTPS